MWLLLLATGGLAAESSDVLACDAGQGPACVSAGRAYFDGEGVPKDTFRAAQLWRRACEAEHAPGCMYLAETYRTGNGLAVDSGKAFELYVAACELGHPVACRSVGDLMILSTGHGVTGDQAGVWYALGCDLGDNQSCTAAGLWFERVGASGANPERARDLFARGCEGGHARGCTLLGIRHQKGFEGAKRDANLAASWFAKGCAAAPTDGEACRELGWAQSKGKGVAPDLGGALTNLDKACYASDPIGCRYLSTLQQKEGDLAEALVAGQRGCDLGDGASCTRAEKIVWLLSMRER